MRMLIALVVVALAGGAHAQTLNDEMTSVYSEGDIVGSLGGTTTNGKKLTFDFNPSSGPILLSSSMTVNGTAMTLLADYDERDISGTTLPARGGIAGTLNEAGSGTGPLSAQPVPFVEIGARGAKYQGNGNKLHDGLPTAIGTGDFAFEFISLFTDNGNTHSIVSDSDASQGFDFEYLAGGNARVIVGDGTAVNVTFGVTSGTWNHVICFGKRTATLRCYDDGANVTNLDISAHQGSITSTNGFEIGGATYAGATATGSETTVIARVWKCTACMNTTAEMDTLAAQRFASVAGGAAVVGALPFPTFTRATIAFADIDRDGDGTRRMFNVGNGWPRVVSHKDSGATLRIGYLSESQGTNIALQSQTLGSAPWTLANVADAVGANLIAAPDGTTTADAIDSLVTAGATEHGVSQTATLTAAPYTWSAYIHAGAQGFAFLRDATVATTATWINLSTCAVGTTGAASTAFAENYGGGWCRLGIAFTGTAAVHTLDLRCASANNTTTYTEAAGSLTPDCYFWGSQLEAQTQSNSPTSYIVTTSASVARNGDSLTYDTGSVPTAGFTGVTDFLCPVSTAVTNGPALASFARDTSNYAASYHQSLGTLSFSTVVGGVAKLSNTAAFNVRDNAIHEIRSIQFANLSESIRDGAQFLGFGTGAIFTPTKVEIGDYFVSEGVHGQPACMILRSRIFSVPRQDATAVLP